MNAPRHSRRRRGSVLVLLAFLLPVLAILAVFTINSAYMQLTRTELMVATDAAARAGGRGLSEYQDVDMAKEAARITAAQNSVAGSPLRLSTAANGDIEFGMATPMVNSPSKFGFTPVSIADVVAGETANAVRVAGRRVVGSQSGPVNMIMSGFVSEAIFQPQQSAVAMQVDRDIVLVLDRSGSMSWKEYDWPRGKSPWYTSTLVAGVAAGKLRVRKGNYYYAPGVDQYEYQDWAWEEHYELGEAPPMPWDNLVSAVAAFLEVLDGTPQTERVALASYASSGSLDLHLTSDYDAVMAELATLGPNGSTAIGMGMQQGQSAVMNELYARPYAAKTMVVMTDGMHNRGIDPVNVATSIASSSQVTIHTVTFTDGADTERMQNVARIGGGAHYHADDGLQLIDTFREVANNLPTILTQ
ncbi:VWA domain-containing protein [Roseimaritima sediminicola]|uniref:VWA domain-containing protein n=1 Tax=Roseimaritima sediminicola TaxID=2662066 RepID=UPI00129854AD|nr:VWA domain-containing protein [Roseimaritima sediminicola]